MPTKRRRTGDCQKCGLHRKSLQRDHIVPRAACKRLGWTHAQTEAHENIQWLCANCHEEKTQEDEEKYRFKREAQVKRWAKPGARERLQTPEFKRLVSEGVKRSMTAEVRAGLSRFQSERYRDLTERAHTGETIHAAAERRGEAARAEDVQRCWESRRANGTASGWKHKPEAKARISAWLTGRKPTPETRVRLSAGQRERWKRFRAAKLASGLPFADPED